MKASVCGGLVLNFEQLVGLHFDHLSESEKDLARYIIAHQEDIAELTLIELGQKVLMSKSTVLRFAKKLGFSGYSEMKYFIQSSLAAQVIPSDQDVIDRLLGDIHNTIKLMENIDLDKMFSMLHKACNVIIYATGFTQSNFAREFSNELFLYKRPNFLLSGETNFSAISDNLTENDFVIIISLSGNTLSIQETLKKLVLKQIPVLSVTAFGDSFLRQHSTYQLYYEVSDLEVDFEDSKSMSGLYVVLILMARMYNPYRLQHLNE